MEGTGVRWGKERLSLAVIVSLLIIALFADLSWIHLIPDVVRAMSKFLISMSVYLLLFPAIPIIYGWITKNEIGTTLAGLDETIPERADFRGYLWSFVPSPFL
jgi:hypothetical protein